MSEKTKFALYLSSERKTELERRYLEDGSQPVGGGCYGKSITDPCLGWEKSERLIYEIADLV